MLHYFVLLVILLVSKANPLFDETDALSLNEDIDFTDWTEIEYREKFEFDLASFPLQIQTNSALGSRDKSIINFWDDEVVAGTLTISFGDELTYHLSACTDERVNGIAMPSFKNRNQLLWTIRKTEKLLTIECNDVLVLQYKFSDSENDECADRWREDILAIEFSTSDDATDLFRVVGKEEFESLCAHSSCYPKWGNLLKGRRVQANSTCGQDGPEEFCLVSNEREEITCSECDENSLYKRHPPNYMKDRRIKSRTTWWKSVNGEDRVTLTLDLETMFQFTHLIMVFYSFRPAAMVIERSTDYAKTWQPYQYFAYDCEKVFGMRERELGEPDEYGVQRHADEDVICTSKYSYLEPAQGGEVIYKVIRGRPTTNTNRASLRNLLLLTNLRVRFVKLHTLGDDLWDPNDLEAKKKYFYAVEDWVVRGSCFCNGHADTCTPIEGMEGSENIKNMINGKCECQHNTAGNNCERCEDFHHSLPWQPGNPATGEAHPCKECSCNGHSDKCRFDEVLYAQTGDGGRCLECAHSTAGPHCDQCVYGYYQVDNRDLTDKDVCQPCNCNEAGTTSQICASVTQGDIRAGTCMCKANVAQTMKCDTCKPDHYNIDALNPLGCTACDCDTRGTVGGSTSCDSVNGQCTCKENVEGRACDKCKVGYFSMEAANRNGCQKCQCDSDRTLVDSCDQITGACICKPGFSGDHCEEVEAGNYVIQLDHWNYDPEDSAVISGEGSVVRDRNSTGTGFVILDDGSSLIINTDNTKPDSETEDVEMSLPTGFYDVIIHHEPADSDYEIILQLEHRGRYDGEKPESYSCPYDKTTRRTEKPYSTQIVTVTVKAGSSATRLEDLCMEEGSQYNMNIVNIGSNSGEGGEGLNIKDVVIVEPHEPEKAFPEDPEKADLYREYQERGCPMMGERVQDVDNECFRIKGQLEDSEYTDSRGAECDISLCLAELDIFDFIGGDTVDITDGAKVITDEGGDVTLPPGSSMTVPLDPGSGGYREIVLSHDKLPQNNLLDVKVTIKHLGNKDGSKPESYRCNGHLNRPYNETTFTVKIMRRRQTTAIGELCLDPAGEYQVTITPIHKDQRNTPDLVVHRVYVLLPDDGHHAFPHDAELADLWDKYIEQGCPKIAGEENHDKEECVEIYNQINGIIEKDSKGKDCSKESCIPYDRIWGSYDPVESLDGGSYINPDTGDIVLPDSGSVVEIPVPDDAGVGRDKAAGSLTHLVIKHDPLNSAQDVVVEVIRTDSDEPYTCNGLDDPVPSTQSKTVTFLPVVNDTLVGYFCLHPEGEYKIRITGEELNEPIRINEIGSALPAHDADAAFPDNPEAADYYREYLKKGCKLFPDEDASHECIHIANLIDYHTNPDRRNKHDCTVQFCYPTIDAFSPLTPHEGIKTSDGADFNAEDGTITIPSEGKVEMRLFPLITGPNTVVIEYRGDNLPDDVEVTISYRGTDDGTNVGEFQCRGRTVKPSSSKHNVQISHFVQMVGFETCMIDNGLYYVTITFEDEGKSIDIIRVYVELPRQHPDTIFPDDPDAGALLDRLVSECDNNNVPENGNNFSAECAAASQAINQLINDNNDKYKVDCGEVLCLPEDNIWNKGDGDEPEGRFRDTTEDGAPILAGGDFAIFSFDGAIAPKGGLNSLIFTVNPEDHNRVVDVLITPVGGSKDDTSEYEMCPGDVSSAKQQLLRKVIQMNFVFVEVGPVCIDPDIEYEVQMIYKGVQPSNSDRIYEETSGINVIIESVDIVLPLEPTEAYPENEAAADIWESYVGAKCPRLSAGFREPSQECLDFLADLQKVVNNVAEEECQVSVCIDNSAGWEHDPISDKESYENGAEVSGGSTDVIISIPPGGEIVIKTGEKVKPDDSLQNLPYTGVMDLLVTHKKGRYAWDIQVDVTHTKTLGNVIPGPFTCLGKEVQPYSTQTFYARTEPCTTETRIEGVCVDKDNIYQIRLTPLRRIAPRVECESADDVYSNDDVFPVDQIALVLPLNPEEAFPDDPHLQDLYKEYLDNNCWESRNKACDDLQIEIMSAMSGQAPGCNCDMRGSVSSNCESVGGQCPCKEGYIGQHCDMCDLGYYGIDDEDGECKPCNCNPYGSKFDFCDFETGQCPCHPGVLTSAERAGHLDCSECVDGHVGLENLGIDGCVACECGPGAALPNCDEVSGTCTCHPGVAQPLCNECSNGFYNLTPGVGCEACECHAPGIDDRGCDDETGECHCKENVVGSRCDTCATNTFSLRAENPAGCYPCYCSGVTDQCTAATGWIIKKGYLPRLKWSVVGGANERRAKYTLGAVTGTEFVWSVEDLGDYYTSYSLDVAVILTGYEDNEVLLRLYRGDTYVTGTLQETDGKDLSISLFEHNFRDKSGDTADLSTFMSILADVTKLEITTIYSNSGRHDQKIREFRIETAARGTSGTPAEAVEQCLCPDGYTGHACGSCDTGFAKSYHDNKLTFSCKTCSELCNGYSDQCDAETGECSNCSGNTVGPHCDSCKEGFYAAEEDGGRLVCEPCPCSRNAASPSCSVGDGEVFPVCDECEHGYTGPNCLDCAPGFYGRDGQCTACECNNNIDLSDPYSCNKLDGVCQNCLYNTTGNECERCLPGFYGNALRAELPRCRECGCHEVGAISDVCDNFSGFCDCLENVTGKTCDSCSPGYWNLTAGTGCQECDCDSRGSLSDECDMMTGQCECKVGIQGLKCNECLAGYYNPPSDSLELECIDCNCDMAGSNSTQCDSTGQCTCRAGVVGRQCDRCARGTTGSFPDCVPCGECYDAWEEEVRQIEGEIEKLSAKAQNTHLAAANLTEEELQDIFADLREDLREAERLARSSSGSEDEIKELTRTLDDLSKALQDKSKDLDDLNMRIDDIDQDTIDTLASLENLNDKLDQFKAATKDLAEKAMNLSAANLDEALKIVESASDRSIAAKQAAEDTKDQITEAMVKATKVEKILKDDVFTDTTSVDKLNSIEEDIADLTGKLGELDASVCGSEDIDSCEPCGGSKCGFCGGPGCGGAVGIISGITELASEARSCADARQSEVAQATAELRQHNNAADEMQENVVKTKELNEEVKDSLEETTAALGDIKRRIDLMLGAERVKARDIEDIVQEMDRLELPLSDRELADLIDDLTDALNDINLVNTDVDISLPDKDRITELLARAEAVSTEANKTLDAIVSATADLVKFDEEFGAAQGLIQDTTEVVNEGWESINEIKQNRDRAETARDGLDQELDDLEKELELLLADIASGDSIAAQAQEKIEEAMETKDRNDGKVKQLKSQYSDLDDLVAEKEKEVEAQLDDTTEGAAISDRVKSAMDGKLDEVEDLTKLYIVQQSTLVDLNRELDELEVKLDEIMEKINVKATYHAQCKNDIPA